MYSINCKHYNKEFSTINELMVDVIESGQDPSYEITLNGEPIGENLEEFIVY